ncbi:TPA-induced transmembrane protein homolog isoform X2 [Gymnodraco acuticeps]|uniref:TPA-induced transmembrane protein homolog isoform X2 n=1 Tax=Gymnodraco acuticeps TaxID=8218 RepID=A0A6P8TG41_GYMAC|nr:TPA-induced transmembrane protein homolog isoform X2 [Gymnodraco acuticeps]
MDIELQTKTNGATYLSKEQVPAGNGDGAAYRITEVGEEDGLLSAQTSAVCRIKGELNEVIFWRVKLWMAIIILFFFIFAVIIMSMLLCSVIHEDKDEIFDPSTFQVPQCFNGSFQLPNLVFTEELFTMSSNESQTLAGELREKLADLYRSSPALGRYFSKADIYAFRNQLLLADFQLTFLMPAEHQDQLRNITLSRKMVYNVFRQFLYDQEPDESGQMYIDPVSLKMFLKH